MKRTRVALCALAFSLVMIAGCGGESGGLLNPQFQPQVTNAPDNFQFQTTAVTNVTQTLSYTWQNAGTQASINQACAITQGSATLTIRDAAGTQVYQANLANNGTFQSMAGQAGNWTIVVTVSNLSGTLNFRVQKL